MYKAYINIVLICLAFLIANTVIAQSSPDIEFTSGQLTEISERYAGSINNWPIVRSLADFNYSTNRYYLGLEEVMILYEFRESYDKLDVSRQKFSRLSTEGGQIFAPQEMQNLDLLFTSYRRYVNDADIDRAKMIAEQIVNEVEEVSRLIDERRIVEVEARLEDKTGRVDRRRGLLNDWLMATIGDLFYRSDGIRTGRYSQAQLLFVDGSDIVLYENTTAVIHQARVDKLTDRSNVEIELSDGSLLTRLTPSARNDSQYRVNAGTSTSNIRSSSFWVESVSDERVTLSNFDGEVLVGAEQVQILLGQNEGTIVERGRAPMEPIPLLPAPELNTNTYDIIHYTDHLEISWESVSGTSFYEIDMAPVSTFDAGLQIFRTEQTMYHLENISEGTNYVQVRAYDNNGLRGVNSRTLRILHIVSDMPPPVILDSMNQPIVFSFESQYLLTGTTEPGVQLYIDGKVIPVDEDGRFETTIDIVDQYDVYLQAVNSAGISREITQTIRFVDPEKLFQLQWSVPTDGIQVRQAPRILISGEAYQFMNVEIISGEHTYNQPVGSSGRWAREVNTENADQILIRFTDKGSGETISEKTFELIED